MQVLGNFVLRKSVLKPFELCSSENTNDLEKYFQSKHVMCLPLCKVQVEFEAKKGRISIVVLGKDGRPKESLEVYSALDRDFSEFFKHFIPIQHAYNTYFYSFTQK